MSVTLLPAKQGLNLLRKIYDIDRRSRRGVKISIAISFRINLIVNLKPQILKSLKNSS